MRTEPGVVDQLESGLVAVKVLGHFQIIAKVTVSKVLMLTAPEEGILATVTPFSQLLQFSSGCFEGK